MTDDLETLKSALQAAPPASPDARAVALALAMENFDRLQGSTAAPRLSSDRPSQAGFLNGVRKMLSTLKSRPYLAATTSTAAVLIGLFVALPQGQTMLPPTGTTAEIPAPNSADNSVTLQLPAATTAAKPDLPADAMAAGVPTPQAAPELLAQTPTVRQRGLSLGLADATVSGLIANDQSQPPEPNTEAFANAPANPVHITATEPVSTFSVDVDTASYAVIRSFLNAGQLPPPDAVRIEEMVNYFPYTYPAPDSDAPFANTVTVIPTPWNPGTRLVHIALQGRLPAIETRPPLNLVFLIDTSGSMDDPAKLPLLKQSFTLMLGQLRPQDRVAIVAYAGSAGTVLPPTAASDRTTIQAALNTLSAGASTAGAQGLALAYQIADTMADPGDVSRVILATDGDFNVGLDSPDALKTYIATQRDRGTYLSVLGFGRGNLDDATMQALAQNGNGTAAYIDTLSEAQKVLSDQLTGALFPIANDVKVQVEWNPAQVAEYRLIGYETRTLRREDFNNDRVDAGEIGAGLQVTALYEVTAPDSPALLNDALRYGTTPKSTPSTELGFLRLRYKNPGQTTSNLIETPILSTSEPSQDAQFAAAIAGFGQLLQASPYLGDWTYDHAIALANSAKGPDDFGYRAEAVTLMRLAQSLSAQ